MVLIAGTVPLSEDTREAALEAARAMAAATQQEEGCIHYQFYVSIDDPNLLLIFEQWESQEALDAHFQTPHMAEFQKQIPSYVAGPMKLHKYAVSASGPLGS